MPFKPFKKEKQEKLRLPERPAPEKERVLPEAEKPPKPELEKPEEGAAVGVEKMAKAVKVTPRAVPPAPRSETYRRIDSILFEGLEQTYQSMPQDLKQEFKKKEQETATQIERIVSQARVTIRKIIELIKAWLKMIPGANRFFLEQEAKIKTKKILELTKKK